MNPIVVQPRNKKESDEVLRLLKQMGIRSKNVSKTELEDAVLAALMSKVNRNEQVSEDSVMKKLMS